MPIILGFPGVQASRILDLFRISTALVLTLTFRFHAYGTPIGRQNPARLHPLYGILGILIMPRVAIWYNIIHLKGAHH